MDIVPKTLRGKWTVSLNAIFLAVIVASIILVKVLGILSFDDHWWDVTVPVVFLGSLIAGGLGICSVIQSKERSVLVYVSIVVSVCAILFIFLHSLFIND
jgi:hypothetical protein